MLAHTQLLLALISFSWTTVPVHIGCNLQVPGNGSHRSHRLACLISGSKPYWAHLGYATDSYISPSCPTNNHQERHFWKNGLESHSTWSRVFLEAFAVYVWQWLIHMDIIHIIKPQSCPQDSFPWNFTVPAHTHEMSNFDPSFILAFITFQRFGIFIILGVHLLKE